MESRNCFVRILLYDGVSPDRVIYLRSGLSVDFLVRWRWFFEYLRARVIVKNPRRKVELSSGVSDVLLGDEWREYKTRTLLKHRRAKLKALQSSPVEVDLFGFAGEERNDDIRKVERDIKLLEAGRYPIAEFPSYVNEIKRWI